MAGTIFSNSSVKLAAVAAATVLGLLAFRRFRVRQWGCCKSKKSLKGQLVIVTGANSGLGKATALELARRGATVLLACKDVKKGLEVVQEILRQVPSCCRNNFLVFHLDLASFDSIRLFVRELRKMDKGPSILINNAGVMACNYALTPDKVETQMSVNHYGPFLLTNLLIDDLKENAPSRIIFVTSLLAKKGDISWVDNEERNRPYNRRGAYADSKLANYIYGRELHKRLGSESGIGVYLVSPGHVWTNLGRHLKPSWWKILLMWPLLIPLAYLFVRTPGQGCQTILHCALEEEEGEEMQPGGLYRNCKQCEHPQAIVKHENMAEQLWNHSNYVTREKNS